MIVWGDPVMAGTSRGQGLGSFPWQRGHTQQGWWVGTRVWGCSRGPRPPALLRWTPLTRHGGISATFPQRCFQKAARCFCFSSHHIPQHHVDSEATAGPPAPGLVARRRPRGAVPVTCSLDQSGCPGECHTAATGVPSHGLCPWPAPRFLPTSQALDAGPTQRSRPRKGGGLPSRTCDPELSPQSSPCHLCPAHPQDQEGPGSRTAPHKERLTEAHRPSPYRDNHDDGFMFQAWV